MEIEIFNETNEKIDEELKIVHQVLEHGAIKLGVDDIVFNVIIVNNDYIHNLNRDIVELIEKQM